MILLWKWNADEAFQKITKAFAEKLGTFLAQLVVSAHVEGYVMTAREEFLRRALLHDQAAVILREEAERHEREAKRLREEATFLEDSAS